MNIEEMRKEFINFCADEMLGKYRQINIEKTKNRIRELNGIIDKMPDKYSETDYQIIVICHQYYRLLDHLYDPEK